MDHDVQLSLWSVSGLCTVLYKCERTNPGRLLSLKAWKMAPTPQQISSMHPITGLYCHYHTWPGQQSFTRDNVTGTWSESARPSIDCVMKLLRLRYGR